MVEFQALILYGDGEQAIFCDEQNVTLNRAGIKVKPILVAPSDELIKHNKLKEDDLNILTEERKKAVWMEYPVDQIDWLRKSKTGAVLFVWCSFDGSRTPMMDKMSELFEMIGRYNSQVVRLRANIVALEEELSSITDKRIEYLRKTKEMVDLMANKKESVTETEGEEYGK